jgi:hypothetical protein
MYYEMGMLMDYMYVILEKFPKKQKERFGLGNDIKALTNGCMLQVIRIINYNPFSNREEMLRELSANLKMMCVFAKIAYKQRLVSDRQLQAWVRNVTKVDNLAVGIAMWMEAEGRKAEREERKKGEKIKG